MFACLYSDSSSSMMVKKKLNQILYHLGWGQTLSRLVENTDYESNGVRNTQHVAVTICPVSVSHGGILSVLCVICHCQFELGLCRNSDLDTLQMRVWMIGGHLVILPAGPG